MSPHVIAPEGELPEVGVDFACMGPEGSQETILVCNCKTDRVLGCDTGAGEGRECLFFGLLCWMAARFGMETIVAEVR